MAIGWNFPSNNFGKINGISEAGIETFRGSFFNSLAKEICQNSLDARVNKDKPVFLEFKLSEIDNYNIPGFDDLFDAIKLCKDFWKENPKSVKFFNEAIKVCNSNKIRVLRISDFNTTGLPGSNEFKSSPWQNLVKSSGVSDKNGTSGGSYGIGKSAPFACSELRTVFYNTLDIDNIRAYQGVANLVSFKYRNKVFKQGEVTQGTGYFGNKSDNSAVHASFTIDGFNRKECGTDIYVLGFIQGEEWEDEIIKAVLDGYLISIINRDIEVEVGNTKICKENLSELIEKYKDEIPLAYNYYQVLTSKETVYISEEFENLGKLSLHILIKKDFRRKVLMARSNGMKIFDKQNISGTIQFAGVCILEDENLNAYFREMETPQHNAWEPDRHTNRKEAQKMKTALFRFIKNKVLEVGRQTITDEMDAVGAGEIIPDINMNQSASDANIESIANEVKDFTIEKVEKIRTDKGSEISEDSEMDEVFDTNGLIDENGDVSGKIYDHDEGHNRGGQRNDKDGKGIVDEKGTDTVEKKISVKPLKMRLINDYRNNKYRFSFTSSKDANNAYIEIVFSGEQSNFCATVSNAKFVAGDTLVCKKNHIYIGTLKKDESYSIEFSVEYDEVCSMGVVIYGYKI